MRWSKLSRGLPGWNVCPISLMLLGNRNLLRPEKRCFQRDLAVSARRLLGRWCTSVRCTVGEEEAVVWRSRSRCPVSPEESKCISPGPGAWGKESLWHLWGFPLQPLLCLTLHATSGTVGNEEFRSFSVTLYLLPSLTSSQGCCLM